jgi:hypothetical protein
VPGVLFLGEDHDVDGLGHQFLVVGSRVDGEGRDVEGVDVLAVDDVGVLEDRQQFGRSLMNVGDAVLDPAAQNDERFGLIPDVEQVGVTVSRSKPTILCFRFISPPHRRR